MSASLQSAHEQLRALERANQKALVSKGEISEESAAAYESGRKLHEKLVGLCTALADLLLAALPVLQEAHEEKKEAVVEEEELEEEFEEIYFGGRGKGR